MSLLGPCALVGLGIALLYAGAESLVRGASRLAGRLGVQPIVIGLTVVAFGTSLPELVVSLLASVRHQPDLAVGNVVGSNIFNLAGILGLAAMVRPLKVEQQSIRREVPFVIGSALLLWFLGRDGVLDRVEGIVLLGSFAAFLWVCFLGSRQAAAGEPIRSVGRTRSLSSVLWIMAGLGLLVVGARVFVQSSVQLGRLVGISELVIGLTVVAVGTSLPELATSVVAAVRKEDDVSVGNLTGSNIFNALFILGVCALIHPLAVSHTLLRRDLPVMGVVSLGLLPIFRTGMRITRLEGGVLLFGWLMYLFIVLR